jgi:diguanylate cyclase (GGDEF)-like protein
MSYDGFEQLSAVAGLSREQDGISLTRVLIHTLRALSPGIDVAVLEVYGHRRMELSGAAETLADNVSVRRFDETGQRAAQRECVIDVAEVIQSLQPEARDSEPDGVGRLVIPLSADIGPLRLVVLDQIPIDPWLRSKLIQVVEIYGNLVKLMDSRERDALTGLLNRQTFAMLFEMALQRANEARQVMALAVLDIDHFKRVNDSFGHLFGDEVLIHFARVMERTFRYTDDLFRFGGEEFVVLLSDADEGSAAVALERFRQTVERYRFPGVGRVTVSIGFTACRPGVLPTTLVDHADQALYHAKQNGRNQVVNHAAIAAGSGDESGAIQLF